MELSVNTINTMNTLLDSISDIYSKSHISDSNFTSFRYERKLEELILDALARYIFNYIEKSKISNEKCCSLLLVKQSNQHQAKISISKILISVNDQQFNDNLIFSNKTMLDNLLKNNFEDIFKVNLEWFDNIKKRIIEHVNDDLKVILNEKNIENFEGSKEFIETILNSIQNSNINFDLYDELLQFLRSIMDIYLITLFGLYYCLENNPNIDIWDVPETLNNNNISAKNNKFVFHSESKLAIYCACKFDRNYINEYIGISKLCCPLCANLLYQLKFKFRGSHSSFSSATNWILLHSVILEDKDLDKIKEPLNEFSTGYLESLKIKLEEFINISNKTYIENIELKENIYNITRPQCPDFIADKFIFDYGQKFRNISLNDFKTLVTIIYENSERLSSESIESENHQLTEENGTDILTIIDFYERLMKKINIQVFKIFKVFYFHYIIIL